MSGGPLALECVGLSVGYGERPVLTAVDLAVAPGEVLALLGPSGSGKTTLLHAVAGFVTPSAGEVRLAGRAVSGPGRAAPPEDRAVGMVFQNYALWPHLSVLDIVGYPLRRRGVDRAAARRAAADLLERMDIAALGNRRPAELSGGEQQRVGLARALAREPAIYLFDEPTAHLDAQLRTAILEEVARRRAAVGAAALYATHDAAEALAIADRVAVVRSGRLVQVGAPEEVYDRPVDLHVARLTGPTSVLEAVVRPAGPGRVTVRVAGVDVSVAGGSVPEPGPGGGPGAGGVPGAGPHRLLVRPHWARPGGPLAGVVSAVRYRGPHTDYHVTTPEGSVLIREDGPPRRAAGSAMDWSLERVWPLLGRATDR